MTQVTDTLAAYIAKEILRQPKRAISATEKLISSGLIDSFSLVDLGLFVETTFGVQIDDTELNAETFDSLEELERVIDEKKG